MQQSLQWCQKMRKDPSSASEFLYKEAVHLPFYHPLQCLAYRQLGQSLLEHGYVVIRLFSEKESDQLVSEFQSTESSFPEYRHGTKKYPYVLGGFGAYGNPASFHNPFVRRLRSKFMESVPILGSMLEKAEERKKIPMAKQYKVALLLDRMCKRPQGSSTSRESYHKDLTPTARPTDITVGGWLQLSKDTSYLSCQPKTHTFSTLMSKKGFALEKDGQCTYDVPVPQGCMVMFFQNLGHCVHSKTQITDSYRVFNVFLLTTHDTSFFDYTKILHDQGVPRLASNQKVPMYSSNHASVWLEKLTIPWSLHTFQPTVLTTKTKKSDGKTYQVVESPMRSLREYGFPMYDAYKPWEKDLFVPNQTFTIAGKKQIALFP